MTTEISADASEYSTLTALGMQPRIDRQVAMCPQQTRPWFSLRLGCVTGSKIERLLTLKGERKAASTVDNLLHELVIEKLAGVPVAQGGQTWQIERGNFCEKLAKVQYWLDYEIKPVDVGYVVVEPGRYGCSPDGLLAPGKGLEIKCRTAKEHLHYLRKHKLRPDDMMQVQFDMWCCGVESWDFYAFWPKGTEHAMIATEGGGGEMLDLPSWLTTVEADERLHAAFDKHVPAFCQKVQDAVDEIRKG